MKPTIRAYRPSVESEKRLVTSTWRHGLLRTPVYCWLPEGREANKWAKDRVRYLLNRCDVLVATNPHDDEHVWGYLVCDARGEAHPICHWVWVRETYRALGIGRLLFHLAFAGRPIIHCSSWTDKCVGLAPRMGLVYSPRIRRDHDDKKTTAGRSRDKTPAAE